MWLSSSPLVTRYLTVAIAAITLFDVAVRTVTRYDTLPLVCLQPQRVVQHWQVHRLVTSAFWHTGVVHAALNLLTLMPLGSALERSLGSAQFGLLVLLVNALADGVYIVLAYAAALCPAWLGGGGLLAQCAVGFSGVLFGLLVIDNNLSGAASRSVFGLLTLPAALFPWALLFLFQFLVPHASFLGHLSGLLVGEAYVRGHLRWALPSGATIQRLEALPPFTLCYSRPGFIAHTGGSAAPLPVTQPASDFPAAASSVRCVGGWGWGWWGVGWRWKGGLMQLALDTRVVHECHHSLTTCCRWPCRSGWLRGLWRPFPSGLQIQMHSLTQRPSAAAGSEGPHGVRLGEPGSGQPPGLASPQKNGAFLTLCCSSMHIVPCSRALLCRRRGQHHWGR